MATPFIGAAGEAFGVIPGVGAVTALAAAIGPLEVTGIVALAVVAVLLILWRLFPRLLLRAFVFVLTRLLYRVRVIGAANIPETGGALLVPNHVSYLDWLFLMAAIDRPIRFILEARYSSHWFLAPFVRSIRAIGVSRRGGARDTLRALREAGEALDRGELVCIFAEGQITRIGITLPFKRGMERILRGRTAPILPLHLDRVWGSPLSRKRARLVLKPPLRIPYPVVLSVGSPLPADTPFYAVRNAVDELEADAWITRKEDRRPLHRAFIRMCRRHPLRFATSDPIRGRLRRFEVVAGAIVLGMKLRELWGAQERVGILLPPSNAAACVNFAATIGGRVVVNLNYTSGLEAMSSAARQAGLRTVVTSRAFLKKAKLELPDSVEPIWAEDLAKTVGRSDRIRGLLAALFTPIASLETKLGAKRAPEVDDVVTVIFSSGSTGEPKGIQLTHFNVSSNAEAVIQVVQLQSGDKLLGILPLFHSFGFLTLWLSATFDIGESFLPNPLDGDAVGAAVEKDRVTIMVATPTFLQIYMRRCEPEQFRTLRQVIVGAEKLPMRLAESFHKRFGVFPLEGYGATECSPVITINVSDFHEGPRHQIGTSPGSVGMPIPGVAVRVVDPDTNQPVRRRRPGMLWVRGPNVMRGYLGRDDLTREALRDGWYVTGDIALQDERGFVTITDRLARFSKIGGEMVPHGKIEEALHDAARRDERVFAVTGVPDDRRGERIAVLHTLDPNEITTVLDALSDSGLPALYVPKANAFVSVDELPLLGTGKLDLAEVKRRARAALDPS